MIIRKTDPDQIEPYLRDASNYHEGHAEAVIIPENIQDLCEFLESNILPVTVSGAGTGLTASRIAESGVVLSLEKFKLIGSLQDGTIEVGAAVSLKELEANLSSSGYFYPPNPTELLASVGGTLATNASGSRSFKMGSTRDHVLAADVVLGDGRRVRLERGNSTETPLKLDNGSSIEFPEISYNSPHCKNAAAYYVQPGMDWLDLFIGSDGTLGVFVSIKLQLARRPAEFISGVLFFSAEENCWNLAAQLRSERHGRLAPCALEYFDHNSLLRLKPKYPHIPERAQAALFFEQDVAQQEDVEACLTSWFEFLEREEVLLDDSWLAQNPGDVEKFHEFRHQIPVLINEENSRLQRVKIGTDMAVSDGHFLDMMEFYRRTLEESGLDHVVFGHLGDNHLHINLLPDKNQLDKAQAVYDQLLTQLLIWGGTVSAEHGIGKLKKNQFARMVGPQAVEELRRIKQRLDPQGILGAGNIL